MIQYIGNVLLRRFWIVLCFPARVSVPQAYIDFSKMFKIVIKLIDRLKRLNVKMISHQAQLFKHGKCDDFLQYGVRISFRSFFGLRM